MPGWRTCAEVQRSARPLGAVMMEKWSAMRLCFKLEREHEHEIK